jgi:hypothetical protein
VPASALKFRSEAFFKDSGPARSRTGQFVGADRSAPRVPTAPRTLEDVHHLATNCGPILAARNAVRDEVFRNGLSIEPRFTSKCGGCGQEFDYEAMGGCPDCGPEAAILFPDETQRKHAEAFARNVMQNTGTDIPLVEVLKAYLDHLTWADGAWLVYRKTYTLDPSTGRIVNWILNEVVPGDPREFFWVIDDRGRMGGKWVLCLRCRRTPGYRPEAIQDPDHPQDACARCSGVVYQVVAVSSGDRAPDRPDEYYLKYEVFHRPIFRPSPWYGLPPWATRMGWDMGWEAIFMEQYGRAYYELGRPPRQAVFVPTRNVKSLERVMKEEEDKNKSSGGMRTATIAYDPGEGRNPGVQKVDFSVPPAELAMTEEKKNLWRRLAALVGVTPIFLNETDAGGLQNQGPAQFKVQNSTVQRVQEYFNEGVLPSLDNALGLTDWHFHLVPHEPADEKAEAELEGLRIDNALKMLDAGWQVIRDERGEFHVQGREPIRRPSAGPDGPDRDPGDDPLDGDDALDAARDAIGKADEQPAAPGSRRAVDNLNRARARLAEETTRAVHEAFQARSMRTYQPAAARAIADRVGRAVAREVRQVVNEDLVKAFRQGHEEAARVAGRKPLTFVEMDRSALQAILQDGALSEAYAGLQEDVVRRVNRAIYEEFARPGAFSVDRLAKRLQREADVGAAHARVIARQETSVASSMGREAAYTRLDPSDEGLYKVIGASDARTTKMSFWIRERVGQGASRAEVRRVMMEAIDLAKRGYFTKGNPMPGAPIRLPGYYKLRGWAAHFQDRDVVVPVTGGFPAAPPGPEVA